jgi:hypothetical protein
MLGSLFPVSKALYRTMPLNGVRKSLKQFVKTASFWANNDTDYLQNTNQECGNSAGMLGITTVL